MILNQSRIGKFDPSAIEQIPLVNARYDGRIRTYPSEIHIRIDGCPYYGDHHRHGWRRRDGDDIQIRRSNCHQGPFRLMFDGVTGDA